ncbi:hypothetical protein TNCV_3215381 [Trichonephila clavipes]|nr:hypothetical protein TNCV_3215381 [Trichonephila clavipes]
MLTLLQSEKLLMLRYMAPPPALRLDDDNTATDDVVAKCLRLAVLQYDRRSKTELQNCEIFQAIELFTCSEVKPSSVPSVQFLGIWLAKRASIPYPVCLCRSDHKVIMLACSWMLIGRANR